MQLLPLTRPATPNAPQPVDMPFLGVGEHVATGHWTAPHGAPSFTAGWWTAGANLAPDGGWTSRDVALEGARLLSRQAGAPIAVTAAFGHDDAPFVMYHAFRLATSDPIPGDAGWAARPTRWLESDMLRAPQFRGWTSTSFAIVGIADRGELLPVGARG